MPHYNQLTALTDLMHKGSPALRVNTDIDRGMLKQLSELSALNSQGGGLENVTVTDDNDQIVTMHDLNANLNGMLDVATIDHPAVTDFLTGNNMGATVTAGGTYDPNSHFLALATHHFDPGENGVERMFDWIGPNAGTPGHEGDLAAIAANAYAHRLADNSLALSLDTNGSGPGHPTLGSINPELNQTLTKNIIPYLGALNGVPDTGIHTWAVQNFGFDDITQMEGMIKALESDPTSGFAINHAGAEWENYMTALYGAHGGDPSYAAAAGRFHQMFNDADHDFVQANKDQGTWDRIVQYNQDSAAWDSSKALVSAGFKFLPPPFDAVGPVLIDLANPEVKLDGLGIANDPSEIPSNPTTDAISAANSYYNTDTNGLYQQYDVATGYFAAHGVPDDPRWNQFLASDGQLSWSSIRADSRKFSTLVDTLPVTDSWNNSMDGYGSGARAGANINPKALPAPGTDPTRRPG